MDLEFYRHIEVDAEKELFAQLFNENNIQFEFSSAETIIDEAIVGSPLFSKYTLKILPKDFQKANNLIRNLNQEINLEDYDHFNVFENHELKEIVLNLHEWSIESIGAAQKILEKRGVEFSNEKILDEVASREEIIKKGKRVSSGKQLFYFLAIAIGCYFSVIFIIAGIGMGYYYAFGRAVDSQGRSFYIFDNDSRNMGKFILFGGTAILILQALILSKYLL